jgi:hypothetical protein
MEVGIDRELQSRFTSPETQRPLSIRGSSDISDFKKITTSLHLNVQQVEEALLLLVGDMIELHFPHLDSLVTDALNPARARFP